MIIKDNILYKAEYEDINDKGIFIVPANISRIENYAFFNLEDKLKIIEIPESVIYIGNDNFLNFDENYTGDYDYIYCILVTIKCKKNSYAEQYAKNKKIKIEYI